ncbi:hypothetical protein SKAU_G00411510 [Synaphobranchus kaupii]|uniref:MULE transposase domain-containing protein n=1 Tax=Synaphobranchus kaupii TaxID=118154 RepID=A0A9Q1E7Y7_SYNKA|nr:hypothetical protein SKAU_G00411510 [Synaphobranchus kaupii]
MRHFSYKYCTLPELTSKRIVICTGREAAIENAIEKVLPTVPIVNCWNHLMQNVKHTVRGCGGTKEDVEVYQAHLNQLLSCMSLTQYHTVKQDISSMWSASFVQYYNISIEDTVIHKRTEEQLKVVVPAPDSKLGIQNQNILADSSATNGQQNVPTHPSKDLKNTDEDINDVLIIDFHLAMFASGARVYHLDHFLTWAIMKGKQDIMSRQLLSKVTFED